MRANLGESDQGEIVKTNSVMFGVYVSGRTNSVMFGVYVPGIKNGYELLVSKSSKVGSKI